MRDKSVEEIIKNYSVNEKSIRQIAEINKCSPTKIRNILIKNNIPRRDFAHALHLRLQNNIPLSQDFLNIIEGELLGDGSIYARKRSGRFIFNNSNKDYVNYLFNEFKKENIKLVTEVKTSTYFHKNWKKEYTIHSFVTCNTIQFKLLKEKWYPKNKKIIPNDLKITPKLLLHWYMGDGTIKKHKGVIELCTDCFLPKDINNILEKINLKLNICSKLTTYSNRPRIYIPRQDTFKFLEFIGPPPFESIAYKWKSKPIKYINELIDIDKNFLCDIYINKNMSKRTISKRLMCSKALVEKKLRKYGIHKRSNGKKIDFDKEQFRHLFIEKNMTQKQMSKLFNCHINRIKSALRKYNIKKGKNEN